MKFNFRSHAIYKSKLNKKINIYAFLLLIVALAWEFLVCASISLEYRDSAYHTFGSRETAAYLTVAELSAIQDVSMPESAGESLAHAAASFSRTIYVRSFKSKTIFGKFFDAALVILWLLCLIFLPVSFGSISMRSNDTLSRVLFFLHKQDGKK